jgi:glycosyltransferase involved in cell wall biosynthesis
MMPRAELVSVVVPTRNAARTLDACLRSVRSQTYGPIELVVVDNHSLDQTPDIAQRYADVFETYGPERSAQRNRGASVSTGDYFLFVDADMTLDPRVVGDCVNASLESGSPGVIIPEISVGEGFLAQCRALERSCYAGDDTIEAARFYTRGAFEASGGFDEALTGPEDWDLSIRIAAGTAFPRTTSHIYHDEGRLRLGTVLAKKYRYAGSSLRYINKHGNRTLGQANLVFRPAFARSWRRLMRHPLLTVGFLSLKGLEAGAIASGLVMSKVRTRSRQGVAPKTG